MLKKGVWDAVNGSRVETMTQEEEDATRARWSEAEAGGREQIRALSIEIIDDDAEEARKAAEGVSRALQQQEYRESLDQARDLKRYLRDNPCGPAPVAADYPSLQADVEVAADEGRTITLADAADEVLATAQAARGVLAEIRKDRRLYRGRVERAATVEEIDQAVADSRAALRARRRS